MAKLFYDHLITWEKLTRSLDTLGAEGHDRIELIEVIEESLHTEILIVILEHLPQEKHEEFLEQFHAAPHDEIHIDFINIHGHPNIEEKIKKRSDEHIEEILLDLLSTS
jgi:hypothetical protein